MSTLADELLNDFEDSGSDRDEQQYGFLHGNATPPLANGHQHKTPSYGSTIMADAEEIEDEDGDEDMVNGDVVESEQLGDVEDEEEAKAKVEKMQLGGVNDVRNIAGLMKVLEPVLEVGLFSQISPCTLGEAQDLHLPQTQP